MLAKDFLGGSTARSSVLQSKKPKREKLPWPVVVPLLWLVLAEPLRVAGVQGPLAAAFAFLVLFFVPAFLFIGGGSRGRSIGGPVVILLIFLLWGTAVSITAGLTREGLQNLSIYGAFSSVVVLSSSTAGRLDPSRLLMRIRVFAVIGIVPALVMGLNSWSIGQRFIGTGALPAIAAIGIIASIVMPKSKTKTLYLLFFLVVIFLSLSRAYIVFAALAMAVPAIRTAKERLAPKFVMRLVLVGTLAFLALTQYPPLRDRFLVNDGVAIGGVDIGTSGRDALWQVMLSEFEAGNRIFGAGAGRSELIISSYFGSITQPHNDYLRLAVDFGLVGLSLWLLAFVLFIVRAVSSMRRTAAVNDVRLHVAAILGLLLILASSFLDNVIIYVFLMVPIAVIIGASFARHPTENVGPESPLEVSDV